jgi:RimJ/RimL family protein N-acetyltransferase
MKSNPVLGGVTLVMDLGALRDETRAALLAAALDDVAAGLGRHAGAETVLTLAGALGGLEGAFHGGVLKKRLVAGGGTVVPARAGAHSRNRNRLVNAPNSGLAGIFSNARVKFRAAPAPACHAFHVNQGPAESAVAVANRPKVQPATIEDLPALTSLVMELFALSDDFTPDQEAQERGLALILEQPGRGRIFVVRNDTRIIGMVNLLFTISTAMGGFVILMEDVIVHPAHRGQGYGTMLLDQVIEFAKQKDFKRITLLTDKISAESQNFFRKNGFEYSNMIPMRRIISA